MVKLSTNARYLVKIAGVLATAAGLALLLAAARPASAHTEGEAGHSHGDISWSWSYGDQLVLTGDISALDGASFTKDDNGKIIWQYVGPSTADDISDCNELGWITLAEKAKSIEAAVSVESEDMASVSLDAGSAADQSRYCFRPQIDVNGETFPFYLLSQPLETSPAQPAEGDVGLVVSETAPPADSEVPTNITVSAAEGTEIVADSWQSAEVDDLNDCNSSNDGIEFSEPAASNNVKDLTAEQAGRVFCFRAQLAGSDQHVYKAYQVPGGGSGSDATSAAGEDDEGVSWVFIVAGVAVIGVIVFIIARAVKSKE